jgi:hypothetical protein
MLCSFALTCRSIRERHKPDRFDNQSKAHDHIPSMQPYGIIAFQALGRPNSHKKNAQKDRCNLNVQSKDRVKCASFPRAPNCPFAFDNIRAARLGEKKVRSRYESAAGAHI